jgi:uncharacterized protein (DUF1800 family)
MKPYQPREFSFADAAHLLRRAGFGGTVDEIEALRKLGPQKAVDSLLTWNDNDATSKNPHLLMPVFQRHLDDGVPMQQSSARTIPTAQAWWLYKMIRTTQPLKEKLTLFWHGHFVSGLDKVRNGFALQQQNELFRRLGQGKFETLVLEVSKNPAMLRYLDNDQNTKKRPNENYAREVMELFTMGVNGGYTEKDVQEAARAFTGWTWYKRRGEVEVFTNPKFLFNKNDHDTGKKTVLGQSGNWDGADVVRITSNHPSTARFMTEKLWRFFVSENLSAATHDELAAYWTKTGGNIREVLRDLLSSEAFYAPENRLGLIKSPIEYMVGAIRSSRAELEPGQEMNLSGLLATMAQIPFYPPDVSGWDGGMDWIADTTVMNRLQFMGTLTSQRLAARVGEKNQPKEFKAVWVKGNTLDETLEQLGRTYLGAKPTGSLEKALRAFAKNRNTPEVAKGLAYLILVSPQYHLA